MPTQFQRAALNILTPTFDNLPISNKFCEVARNFENLPIFDVDPRYFLNINVGISAFAFVTHCKPSGRFKSQ